MILRIRLKLSITTTKIVVGAIKVYQVPTILFYLSNINKEYLSSFIIGLKVRYASIEAT